MELHETFKKHARRRRGIEWLQNQMYRVIHSETPATETIVVEELPLSESEMPQADLQELFNILGVWENSERTKMNSFQQVYTGLPEALQDRQPPEDKAPDAKPEPTTQPKKRKPRSKP